MKFPVFASLTLAAGMVLAALPAHAQDDQEKHNALMQDYNDSQFCAALLDKLGGADNQRKSALALAHAKSLAPAAGQGTEAEFKQSYQETVEILAMASEDEMKQFTKFCLAKW